MFGRKERCKIMLHNTKDVLLLGVLCYLRSHLQSYFALAKWNLSRPEEAQSSIFLAIKKTLHTSSLLPQTTLAIPP